jgi:hypothetical protein
MTVAKTIQWDAQTERPFRVLSQRKRIEARLEQHARIVLPAAGCWLLRGWRTRTSPWMSAWTAGTSPCGGPVPSKAASKF